MSQFVLDRLKEELGEGVLETHNQHGDETATIAASRLLQAARFLRDDPALDMKMLVDITAVDHPERENRLEVVYHFHSLEKGHRLRLKLEAPGGDDPEVESLTKLWKGADWQEREVYDMFGVRFRGHPDLRRLLLYPEFVGHPLRKDYSIRHEQPRIPHRAGYPENDYDAAEDTERLDRGLQRALSPLLGKNAPTNGSPLNAAGQVETKSLFLDMGPSHPAMHGTIRISVELSGEKILACDADIGFLHRGFEKTCENVTYNGAIPYTDRLNYVSPIINNVGWSLAAEKLLGVEVPERCQALRVITSEISRVADHLTCIAATTMECGAFTAFLYLIEGREEIYKLIERFCGGRVTTSYTCVGGVKADLPDDFEAHMQAAFAKTRQVMADVVKLMNGNRIFQDRMIDVGAVSQEDAISWGMTGPFIRATGIPYDIRKVAPYSGYERYDFEVPIGSNGDNWDRYLVRMEETRQSMRIAEQAFAKLPSGPIVVADPHISRPPKSEVYTSIEGLMHHFMLTMSGQGVRPDPGEAYAYVEGGNGELGFYVVSDGTEKAYRAHCRPPCFAPMSALPTMLVGHTIADVIATFGTVNMIGGELDR